jgi:hypothetical protein
MSFEEFLAAPHVPPNSPAPLAALWHDAHGDWAKAHACVQDDTGRDAAWVHAYLHRKEGDDSNAGYWYARAGRARPAKDLTLETERIAIGQALV